MGKVSNEDQRLVKLVMRIIYGVVKLAIYSSQRWVKLVVRNCANIYFCSA